MGVVMVNGHVNVFKFCRDAGRRVGSLVTAELPCFSVAADSQNKGSRIPHAAVSWWIRSVNHSIKKGVPPHQSSVPVSHPELSIERRQFHVKSDC